MTKTFNEDNLIKVEGGYVVVDKKATLRKGDIVFDTINEEICKLNTSFTAEQTTSGKNIPCWYLQREPLVFNEAEFLIKIICSIQKRIEGVPLIELPEMGIHKNAYPAYEKFLKEGDGKGQYTFIGDQSAHHSDGFAWGYTVAAQQQGRYSKEDMLNCWKAGIMNTAGTGKDEIPKFRNGEHYLLSLQTKRPISVELEYYLPEIYAQHKKLKDLQEDNREYKLIIHNPETNVIIPKSISYG